MSNRAVAAAKSVPAKKRVREQWDQPQAERCAPTFGEGVSFNNRPFSSSPEAFEGIADLRRPSRTSPLPGAPELSDEFLAWEAAGIEAWNLIEDNAE